jgi:hypothetical protein
MWVKLYELLQKPYLTDDNMNILKNLKEEYSFNNVRSPDN